MAKKVMASSNLALAMVMLAQIASQVNAISCTEAVARLLPCEPYLVGFGSITAPCCQAAQSLNQLAVSKPDCKTLCRCFEIAGPSLGVKSNRAKQLPQLCNIEVPVPIDLNVNCDTV